MAIEMVPYTNFHDLNLDWILKTVKDLQTHIDSVDAVVEDAEEFKNQAESAAESAAQSVIDASDYANNARGYANNASDAYDQTLDLYNDITSTVQQDVSDWLALHVDPDTGYVIDDTLTVQGAAADAKAAGDRLTTVEGTANGNSLAISLMSTELAAVSSNFADVYANDSSVTYSPGDVVVRNNLIFRCVAATTGGNWDSDAWENVTVEDLITVEAAATLKDIPFTPYDFSFGDFFKDYDSAYLDDFTARASVIDADHEYTAYGDVAHMPNIVTGTGLTRTGASGMSYLWINRNFSRFPFCFMMGLENGAAQYVKFYNAEATNATSYPYVNIHQSSRVIQYNGAAVGGIHKTAKYCIWYVQKDSVTIIDDTGITNRIPIQYNDTDPMTVALGFAHNSGRKFTYGSFVELIKRPLMKFDVQRATQCNREDGTSTTAVLTSVRFTRGQYLNGQGTSDAYVTPELNPAMALSNIKLSNNDAIECSIDYSNNNEYRSEIQINPVRVTDFSQKIGGLQRIVMSANCFMPSSDNPTNNYRTYIVQIHDQNFAVSGWHDPPPLALKVYNGRLYASVAYRQDGSVPTGDDVYVSDDYDLCAFSMDTWHKLELEMRIGWMNSLAPSLIVRVDGVECLNLQTPIGFNIVSSNGYVDSRFGLYCPEWISAGSGELATLKRKMIYTNIKWSGTMCTF